MYGQNANRRKKIYDGIGAHKKKMKVYGRQEYEQAKQSVRTRIWTDKRGINRINDILMYGLTEYEPPQNN